MINAINSPPSGGGEGEGGQNGIDALSLTQNVGAPAETRTNEGLIGNYGNQSKEAFIAAYHDFESESVLHW